MRRRYVRLAGRRRKRWHLRGCRSPAVPAALKQQLAVGGRLVIPVGTEGGLQELLCITRLSDSE